MKRANKQYGALVKDKGDKRAERFYIEAPSLKDAFILLSDICERRKGWTMTSVTIFEFYENIYYNETGTYAPDLWRYEKLKTEE